MARDSADAIELPFVSVVIPVKNGAGRIEHCLVSLSRQDYPQDRFEVIVADGQSTDATVEIARSLGARVVPNPRQIVASGRNVGVRASRGDCVVFTDDDCVLPPEWIRTGVEELERSGAAAVGGPTPIPETSSAFSRAVNLIFRLAAMGGSSVQSEFGEIGEATDLPGGNTMYRRAALEGVGEINESMITAEDVELHLRLRNQGNKLHFSPAFTAEHHKRDSPKGFFNQMRRFAIGRVQLLRIQGEGMKASHWLAGLAAPIALVVAAVMLAFGQVVPLVVSAAFAWLILALTALISGETPAVAWRLGPTTAIFLCGWAFGLWSEVIHPISDTSGR